MKKQLFILLIILLILAACGAHGEVEHKETLNVEDWPEQISATAVPTVTPFPRLDDTLVINTDQSQLPATDTEITQENTTQKPAEIPPSVKQALMDQLGAAELLGLMKQADDGATPAELLVQIDEADLQAIITQVDPVDMEQMVQNISKKEAEDLLTALGDSAPADLKAMLEAVPETANSTNSSGMAKTESETTNANDTDALLALLSEADPADIAAKVNEIAQTTLPLQGTSIVEQANVAQRLGPGSNYGSAGTLPGGSIAGIYGRDNSGAWIYVITPDYGRGWLPLSALKIVGNITDIPILPANPEPDVPMGVGIQTGSTATSSRTPFGAVANSNNDRPTSSSSSSQPAKAPTLAELDAVTSATLNNKVLNMRQGPGANYDLIATLEDDDALSILALNKTEDWLLVKTTADAYGWVSKELVNVDGSLASAPVVVSARPGSNIPTGQIAPISSIRTANGETVNVSQSASTSTNSTSITRPTSNNSTTSVTAPPQSHLPGPLSWQQYATLRIDQPKVLWRLGPATTFGQIDELTHDDEDFYLFAVDASGQWGLVKRAYWEKQPHYGWLNLNEMKVMDGDVTSAPTMVTTWVKNNAAQVRNGPGLTYDQIGHLGFQTLLGIQSIYKGRNWLMITPVDSGVQVWISRNSVADIGSLLAAVPEVDGPVMPDPDHLTNAYGAERVDPTGTLAFQTASGDDIKLIEADGSGLRTLAKGLDPVFSPDGQQVAFTRWGNGDQGSLWTINADGTGERLVFDTLWKAKGPTWSPDGSQIMLNYMTDYQDEEQKCANLSKGSPSIPREAREFKTKIRDGGVPYLCWTIPPSDQWNLRVINIATGDFRDRDGGIAPFRPTWDPARSWRIVYDGQTGLAELDVNENKNQAITDIFGDGSPVFSPNGEFIALVTTGKIKGGGADIYRVNNDGGNRVQLTKTPLWVTTGPDATKSWNNVAPTWSPDGRLIAFLTDRSGQWEIWVMNADGSDQRAMFPDAINNQLAIQYNFVDERVLSWAQ